MKDYDNRSFYNSTAWRKVSSTYLSSKNYLCERCGAPATICHHRQWLDGANVHDPNVALNFDNLEALCQDCHNREHFERRATRIVFSAAGEAVGALKGPEELDFEAEKARIDAFLAKIRPETAPDGPEGPSEAL